MEPLFEGLTASEIEYLQYLQKRGYFDGFAMNLAFDTSSDYRFDKFVENGYVTKNGPGTRVGTLDITITGKGIAAIVDYEKYQKREQPITPKDNDISRIAVSLEKLTESGINLAQYTQSIALSSSKQANSIDRIAQETAKQDKLTLVSKKILFKLYKEYLDRRKLGFSLSISKNLGSFEEINANFFSDMLSEDLNNSLHELMDNGFLDDILTGNTMHSYELSNYAIATLEAIPTEAIRSLAKFIPNLVL